MLSPINPGIDDKQAGPHSRDRLWIGAAILLFAALQLAVYPVAISIKDEAQYAAFAYALKGGSVFADVAQVPMWPTVLRGGHLAPLYPPGEPLLLLGPALVSWRMMFVVGLAAHIAGTVLFARLLESTGIRPRWALLYLFFPAFVLFSRTLMAEIPSALLVTGALLAYRRGGRGHYLAGALLGASLFLRYANVFTVALVALAAAVRDIRQWRTGPRGGLRLPRLAAGFAIPTAALAAYTYLVYGAIGSTGYSTVAPASSAFSAAALRSNLPFYIGALSLMYPLMVIVPLTYRGPLRLEVVAITLGVLIAMSVYAYRDDTNGWPGDLLVGIRLLLPAVPAWLLGYADLLDRLTKERPAAHRAAVAVLAVGGVVGAAGVSLAHEHRLKDSAATRDFINAAVASSDLVLTNPEGTKFLSAAWGSKPFIVATGDPSTQPDLGDGRVAVVFVSRTGDDDDRAILNGAVGRLGATKTADRKGTWEVEIWRR